MLSLLESATLTSSTDVVRRAPQPVKCRFNFNSVKTELNISSWLKISFFKHLVTFKLTKSCLHRISLEKITRHLTTKNYNVFSGSLPLLPMC